LDKLRIPESVITAISIIKSFAKYLIIPTGVITFFPDDWLNFIRLLGLKNSTGSWIAGLFLLSMSIVVIDFTIAINKKVRAKKAKKNMEKSLHRLSNAEKSILFQIFKDDFVTLPADNAVVDKLERLFMITKPNISVEYMNFSYTLQPWVHEYISNNPDFFKEDS